ncbi:MAG: hypothetical protein KDC71_13300 [Acidobacteria bacterium]|nr:hypothetical protein [Acidobacteriota bacterium]
MALVFIGFLWLQIDTQIIVPPQDISLAFGSSLVCEATATGASGSGLTFRWLLTSLGNGIAQEYTGRLVTINFDTAGDYVLRCTASLGSIVDLTPAQRLITVLPNQAPHGEIEDPSQDGTVALGTIQHFEGQGSDPEGHALSYLWQVTRPNGTSFEEMGRERNFQLDALGTWTFLLVTTDAYGLADPQPPLRIMTVESQNPPDTVILSPLDGERYPLAEPLEFRASGSGDAGAVLTFHWLVSGPNGVTAQHVGELVSFTPALAGNYAISCQATDQRGLGDPTPAEVQITVVGGENVPPTLQIVQPLDNPSVERGDSVHFEAQVIDENPSTVRVFWRVTGGTVPRVFEGRQVEIDFPLNGVFDVSVSGVDESGATSVGDDARTVTVSGEIEIETTILEPLAGLSFLRGTAVRLSASSNIPDALFAWTIRNASANPNPVNLSGNPVDFLAEEMGIFHVECRALGANGMAGIPATTWFQVRDFDVEILEPESAVNQVGVGSTTTLLGSIQGGIEPVTSSWALNGVPFANDLQTSITWQQAGSFGVTLTAIDAQGNQRRALRTFEVLQPGTDFEILSPLPGQSIAVNEQFDLEASVPNQLPGDLTFTWLIGARVFSGNPVRGLRLTQAGDYIVRLLVRSASFERRLEQWLYIYNPDSAVQPRIHEPNSDLVLTPGSRFYASGSFDGIGHTPTRSLDWLFKDPSGNVLASSQGPILGFVQVPQTSGVYSLTLNLVEAGSVIGQDVRQILVAPTDSSRFQNNLQIETAAPIALGDYTALDGSRPHFFELVIALARHQLLLNFNSSDTFTLALYRKASPVQLLSQITVDGDREWRIPALPAGTYVIGVTPKTGPGKKDLSFGLGVRVIRPTQYLTDVGQTGVAQSEFGLINPNETSISTEIVAFDETGAVLSRVNRSLGPKARVHLPTNLWFGDMAAQVRWVRIDADGEVRAYSLTCNYENTELVALSAAPVLSDALVIPHVAQKTDQWFTRFSAVNGSENPGQALLSLGDSQTSLSLNQAYTNDNFDFLEKFGGQLPSGPEWGTTTEPAGSALLAASEVFGKVDGNQQAGGLTLEPLDRSNPNLFYVGKNLYFAHIAKDTAQFWTGIALVNSGDSAQDVLIKAYGVGGSEVASLTRHFEAQEKWVGLAEDLLSGVDIGLVDWLEIGASADLTGYELFGTYDNKRLAAFEATAGFQKDLIFPFLDPLLPQWYGLAIVNMGNAPASMDLTLYDNDGAVLSSVQRSLDAHEKWVFTLDDLFGSIPVNAGWVRCQADQNLMGFELFGGTDGETMAALRAE